MAKRKASSAFVWKKVVTPHARYGLKNKSVQFQCGGLTGVVVLDPGIRTSGLPPYRFHIEGFGHAKTERAAKTLVAAMLRKGGR